MPATAIVTGGASGIGLACARMLRAEGCRLAVFDLNEEAIRRALPDAENVLPVQVDISDPEACRRAVARAQEWLGSVEALLHFAAAWAGTTWGESQPAEWDRLLAVNVKGTFFLAQAVANHMIARGDGVIVLTASDSARVGGVAGGPAYVASKGAVMGLTRSLAKALGPSGVRVNAVSPGVVETPMTAAWPKALKEAAVSQTPLGRLAVPEDVAGVACFLVSDRARFMTGEIVEVNGGYYFD